MSSDVVAGKVDLVHGTVLYRAAPALQAQGDRIVTTDELTGIQALERKHPGLPLAPGKVARREFEYIRHGTCTGILYYNRTMAKPFKWTYQGKPLVA